MNKKSHNKTTYVIACKRFEEQGRTDIQLCEEGYFGWHSKSKFFDIDIGEYFWSIPYDVYRHKSGHKKRTAQKRKKSLINRYGIDYQLDFIEKSKATNRRKYGVDFPFQSQIIRDKQKSSLMDTHGVENPFSLKKYQDKAKHTIQEKYGTDNISKLETVKNKKREKFTTNFKNGQFIDKIFYIVETKESLPIWLARQPDPKPCYSSIIKHFNEHRTKEIHLSELNQFLAGYTESKSSLEMLCEIFFQLKHFNKSVGHGMSYRPDFKINDDTFLNIDGLYWHSELGKQDKHYHFNMRKRYELVGLRILQIREDELKTNSKIIRSMVNNILGKSNKIFGRKTTIKIVPQQVASLFLSNNHLMGDVKAKHVGLYDQTDELICLMSFKIVGSTCKIERFCTKIDNTVVGGFTKLLTFIEKQNTHLCEIHNWVDLRYGVGTHLLEKGFVHVRETHGWKWTDGVKTYNRLRCMANMDSRKLSEKEYAKELKWYKIHDAGQRLFVKQMKLGTK